MEKKYLDLLKIDTEEEMYEEEKKRAEKNPWRIADNGDIIHLDLRYNPPHETYYIHKHDLVDPHWIQHLKEKTWVDMKDFLEIYFEALMINDLMIQVVKIPESDAP